MKSRAFESFDFMVRLEVKLEIAQEVNSGPFKAWRVHKERNMPLRTVVKYAHMCKKGLAMHESAGRPRLLDTQAIDEILDFLSSDPDPNYSTYRALVLKKCNETWLRRHLLIEDDSQAPKVSVRAVAVYMKKLKTKAKNRSEAIVS